MEILLFFAILTVLVGIIEIEFFILRLIEDRWGNRMDIVLLLDVILLISFVAASVSLVALILNLF